MYALRRFLFVTALSVILLPSYDARVMGVKIVQIINQSKCDDYGTAALSYYEFAWSQIRHGNVLLCTSPLPPVICSSPNLIS